MSAGLSCWFTLRWTLRFSMLDRHARPTFRPLWSGCWLPSAGLLAYPPTNWRARLAITEEIEGEGSIVSEILVQVIAGVIVAAVAGASGFLLRTASSGDVLPVVRNGKKHQSYEHLSGRWNLYYLTRASSISGDPFWVHGINALQVTPSGRVRGETEIPGHPTSTLDYVIQGEIRHGRMILTDSCRQDDTEFASIIYPNLRPDTILVGIWVGFDNDVRLVSGVAVLSRDELNGKDLNQAALASNLGFIPAEASYKLQPDKRP